MSLIHGVDRQKKKIHGVDLILFYGRQPTGNNDTCLNKGLWFCACSTSLLDQSSTRGTCQSRSTTLFAQSVPSQVDHLALYTTLVPPQPCQPSAPFGSPMDFTLHTVTQRERLHPYIHWVCLKLLFRDPKVLLK